MVSEGLAMPINIHLYEHVIGHQYNTFIADYSQYQVRLIVDCFGCFDWCRNGWFIFNCSTIDKDEFLIKIQADNRVGFATYSLLLDLDNWRVRTLAVSFRDESDLPDFLKDYSEHSLRGSIFGGSRFLDRHIFTFDDTVIYTSDIINMVSSDSRVLNVDVDYGWYPGFISLGLEGWVVGEYLETFIENYLHYEIKMVSYSQNPDVSWWFIYFNYVKHDEFVLLNELNNDERVRSASFSYVERIPICYGPITVSDSDQVSEIPPLSIFVYPNPAGSGDVVFKISSHKEHSSDDRISLNPSHEINIYNIRGQMIKRSNDFQNMNSEIVFVWNQKDKNNNIVPSGVYLYRIDSNGEAVIGRLLVLKLKGD
jgi:hypothetical protein